MWIIIILYGILFSFPSTWSHFCTIPTFRDASGSLVTGLTLGLMTLTLIAILSVRCGHFEFCEDFTFAPFVPLVYDSKAPCVWVHILNQTLSHYRWFLLDRIWWIKSLHVLNLPLWSHVANQRKYCVCSECCEVTLLCFYECLTIYTQLTLVFEFLITPSNRHANITKNVK